MFVLANPTRTGSVGHLSHGCDKLPDGEFILAQSLKVQSTAPCKAGVAGGWSCGTCTGEAEGKVQVLQSPSPSCAAQSQSSQAEVTHSEGLPSSTQPRNFFIDIRRKLTVSQVTKRPPIFKQHNWVLLSGDTAFGGWRDGSSGGGDLRFHPIWS